MARGGGQRCDELQAAHVHDALVEVLKAPADVVERQGMGLAELGVQFHGPASQGAVKHPVVSIDDTQIGLCRLVVGPRPLREC
jgi:hypothetical protein